MNGSRGLMRVGGTFRFGGAFRLAGAFRFVGRFRAGAFLAGGRASFRRFVAFRRFRRPIRPPILALDTSRVPAKYATDKAVSSTDKWSCHNAVRYKGLVTDHGSTYHER